jgi:hypothetical protein
MTRAGNYEVVSTVEPRSHDAKWQLLDPALRNGIMPRLLHQVGQRKPAIVCGA